MAKEFKSFFKTVGGGEGQKCKYPTRLDTYGCGCQHDCDYCYAKSLLYFRKQWNAKEPAVADIKEIAKIVKKIPLIEEFMNFDKLNSLGIQKGIVEFLRINSWISKWLRIDERKYTYFEGGYKHLPLEEKARIMSKIQIPELSACEDVKRHYLYLNQKFNPNKEDCCNLRR